ncbi:MAG TPA: ATP-binding protein [Deferrimonas sp.]
MNYGIRVKVLTLTAGIMLLALGATILTSGYQFAGAYTEALQSRSLAIGKSLKLQLDRLLLLGIRIDALTGFDEQCRDIVDQYEGIEYAMVADPEGRILFHNDPARRGTRAADGALPGTLQSREAVITSSMENGMRRYCVFIPVFDPNGKHVAAVGIGFPADLIAVKTREMTRYAIGVGLLFLVCAVIALLAVLSFKVTKPLTRLLAAIQEIRQKGTVLAGKVVVGSRDEIGQLAAAFNLMTDELRWTTVSKAELERQVEERTRQLVEAQEELVRKEKLAILGQLAGSVGHELRNPLGGMSNAVYFLKTVLAGADETTMEYLDIIKHEINNSQRIISDLLDFARTGTPQTQAVTARELLEESLGKCAFPENVVLRTEISETLPALRVDPLQIGQIFQNLITNAVQAMPRGGSLRIGAKHVRCALSDVRRFEGNNVERRTSNIGPDTDFVEISVEDSGEGITPENLKKLFQPLFTTKPKGIGLGLVVCKNLTEANGGGIEVESRPGEGTTFTVILPVEEGKLWEKS